jgi:hypothetical protein
LTLPTRTWALAAWRAAVACASCTLGGAWAGGAGSCSATEHDAPTQDRLLQVAGVLKAALDTSGERVAIVARSGQALQRLGHRYSHAGVALKDSPQTPWAVRQLYFACDEQRPRIFDQGLSGFVMGTHDPSEGYLSVLLLPPEAAGAVLRSALDDAVANQLLGTHYSANAHAFSLSYQNCNQWVAELLATAWAVPGTPVTRRDAQDSLRQQGYQPSPIDAAWPPLTWAAAVLPWFHVNDHPHADLAAGRFWVSMPEAIASWVQNRWPTTTRWELCHNRHQVVVRRNGPPLAPGCQPETGDEVHPIGPI